MTISDAFDTLSVLEELELKDNPALLQITLQKPPLSAALCYIKSPFFRYTSADISQVVFYAINTYTVWLISLDPFYIVTVLYG